MSLDSRWLQFAQEDLKMAALAMDAAIWNQACFHSQQAAEKLLKANLAGAPPKTHKLADLLHCTDLQLPEGLAKDLLLLDRFYIPVRYPDALPGSLETGLPNEQDARLALRHLMSFCAD